MNVAKPPSAQDRTDDVVAANEALVLAALRAMEQADEAILARFEAERVGGLDALTQIPGRAQTLEALVHAVAQARRGSTRLALLFLDLDHFKRINDECGHGAGDEVLRTLAVRMKQVLREADFVGRYGGDEFVVLLTDVAHPADVIAIAEKLVVALYEPLRVGGDLLRVTPSIGIALFPEDANAGEALLARADAAMYCAKKAGPGRYAFSHAIPSEATASLRAPRVCARSQAVSDPEDALRRDAELGLLVALLRARGVLRGVPQLGKIVRLSLSRGHGFRTRGARCARGSACICPRLLMGKVAAGILLSRASCRGRCQQPSQLLRRIGRAPARLSPRRGAILCGALLGDAIGLAHEDPCGMRIPGRDMAPLPGRPDSAGTE
jgi:diguanylate cyclase (GGDEF)-like protein